MNLHTTYIDRRTPIKRTRTSSRKKGSGSFAVVFKIIALLIVIFMVASTRALFNSEIEKLNRRAVKLKGEIHSLNRDVANLEIRQEQYHGRYILNQIKNLGLKLQYPRAGQVRKISVYRQKLHNDQNNAETSEILLSQR